MAQNFQITSEAEQLLQFWFSEQSAKRWFRSTPEFDEELRQRFGAWVEAGLRGELNQWPESPRGALALVILLDQLPLNIYRGTARSFSCEAASIKVAASAIEKGWDEQLSSREKAFLYLPFMHSESLADQERSVELFRAANLKDNLRWAEHHRELIRRFGRFPHRNALLGRESTQEERDYLASDRAFRG